MSVMKHDVLRSVCALVLPALLVVGLVVAWAWRVRGDLAALGRGYSVVDLQVLPELRGWRERPAAPGVVKGAFFGDSVVWGSGMPALLAADLEGRGVHVDVAGVAHVALRPMHFYYLLDQVLAGRPRFVVAEVNLPAFSSQWADAPAVRLRHLSREMSIRRAWRVRVALRDEQIGLLDPFLYRMENAVGLLYVPDGARERGQMLVDDVTGLVARRFGIPLARRNPSTFGLGALDVGTARGLYGIDPATHRTALVLRELLRGLREAGVGALLYVTPVNVGRLAELSLEGELSLDAKIGALRVAVGASEEEWLDLHDALPTQAIRDAVGHLNPQGAGVVVAALGDKLAKRLPAVMGGGRRPRK